MRKWGSVGSVLLLGVSVERVGKSGVKCRRMMKRFGIRKYTVDIRVKLAKC